MGLESGHHGYHIFLEMKILLGKIIIANFENTFEKQKEISLTIIKLSSLSAIMNMGLVLNLS